MKNGSKFSWRHGLAVLAVALSVSACTNVPQNAQEDDPNQSFNRAMFSVHETLDGLILKPAAMIYRGVVPEFAREMVDNFLTNLSTPTVSANAFLQGDPEHGFTSFWRFFFNSTIGFGGVFDVATEMGLKPYHTDFGLTMARYGVESGSYLFLPIIGPTTPRDTVGMIVNGLMDPFNYYDEGATLARGGAVILNERTKAYKTINDIYRDSLDPYSTIRSGWTQKRANEVRKTRAIP